LRLDKYLYFCRFAKSRSKAQAILLGGHLRLNGKPITSLHYDAKPGDVLTIMLGGAVRVIHITALPVRRGPAVEAQSHYSLDQGIVTIDAGEGGF
jgi:ribosome-associated heat shock protein Hsp15